LNISRPFQEPADCNVITRRKKYETTSLGAKDQPKVEAGTALEEIPAQATNAEPGMKMWFAESVPDRVNGPRHLAATRLAGFSHVAPKRFCEVNLQGRLRDCRCIS
jgi:hypothetical protein